MRENCSEIRWTQWRWSKSNDEKYKYGFVSMDDTNVYINYNQIEHKDENMAFSSITDQLLFYEIV